MKQVQPAPMSGRCATRRASACWTVRFRGPSRLAIRFVVAIALLFTPWSVLLPAAQEPAATRVTLAPAAMEEFLLRARIVGTRAAGSGITNSIRATLSDGTVTHDAQIQTVDQTKPIFRPSGAPPEFNFTDSYRYNVAGYKLAVLLGLDNVPMSVERNYNGRRAAFTWWLDDVMMDEKARVSKSALGPDRERTAMQLHIMRVFDELVQNRDRNMGNLLWTTDWKMWLIDHTRAFRTSDELVKPEVLERIERSLFQNIRGLTEGGLKKATGRSLADFEIGALLKRRDRMVKLFEARIAERGEAAVLYTLPR
jgi:hypothetical protein